MVGVDAEVAAGISLAIFVDFVKVTVFIAAFVGVVVGVALRAATTAATAVAGQFAGAPRGTFDLGVIPAVNSGVARQNCTGQAADSTNVCFSCPAVVSTSCCEGGHFDAITATAVVDRDAVAASRQPRHPDECRGLADAVCLLMCSSSLLSLFLALLFAGRHRPFSAGCVASER